LHEFRILIRGGLRLFTDGCLPKSAFDITEGFGVAGDGGVHCETAGGRCKQGLP
jgi:hypothetical protein